MMNEKIKIAVLVSGGGTNLQALIDAEHSGEIKSGNIALVVSNVKDAYALTRAENAGIENITVSKKELGSQEAFEDKLISELEKRGIGFHQMDVYIVIDENGAIAKIDAKQFIFDEEYFGAFGGMNVGEYKGGFVGVTEETWTGDQAIIATATMTSNAMKESTTDAFASFNSIKGGEQ